MQENVIVPVVILVALAALAIGYFAMRKRRLDHVRARFGPEYDRAVEDSGSRARAAAELREREKRVGKFTIKPLAPEDRARFASAWTEVQAQFVEDPNAAITHADELLGAVMAARGYPVGDFGQRAADLSVDHPVVVQEYRTAHDIALRHEQGEASTEDLRQAMLSYRTLYDELIKDKAADTRAERDAPVADMPANEPGGRPLKQAG